MKAKDFESLICDKLGMFTGGSIESLAKELERLFRSNLFGYYNYCMDNYDGNASEEAIDQFIEESETIEP